jgi:Protein of unknown function (DUF3891)
MLLRTEEGDVLAIGQQSHAWISGQLARVWGNDRFLSPEPWEEVCLAAEQHDIGFSSCDLDPILNPDSGLPYSFMEMPLPQHLGVWSDAPRRLLAQSRYAALLVSMHGARLYRRRNLEELGADQAEAVRTYLRAEERFQGYLISSLRTDPARLERNSQLVWIWDFLSLVICLDWAPRTARDAPSVDGPVDIEIVPGQRPRTATLTPWPFRADAVSVHCDCRRLQGRFETDDGLRDAFARASWERLEFEFLRAS